jgi:hypothetical protein
MRFPFRVAALALTLGAGITSPGCLLSPGHGWGGGGSSVSRFEDGVNIHYTADYATCDGQVYLVVCANGCHGSGAGGSGANFGGQLHADDGREVTWSSSTRDGRQGSVVIDGRKLDLAKGAVFLVSLRANQTRVEQVAVNLADLQDVNVAGRLQELAKTEPRLADFFASCREKP